LLESATILERRRDPENAPLLIEAILLERVLLDGRPRLEIVARLAAIDEDRTDEAAARDLFWRDARRKLGKQSECFARGDHRRHLAARPAHAFISESTMCDRRSARQRISSLAKRSEMP
jgi:hypothetical protein